MYNEIDVYGTLVGFDTMNDYSSDRFLVGAIQLFLIYSNCYPYRRRRVSRPGCSPHHPLPQHLPPRADELRGDIRFSGRTPIRGTSPRCPPVCLVRGRRGRARVQACPLRCESMAACFRDHKPAYAMSSMLALCSLGGKTQGRCLCQVAAAGQAAIS